MAELFKRRKTCTVLDLNGAPFVILGIILMLLPFPWSHMVALTLDAAGYLLMAVGLFMLHYKNIGFAMADLAAICALAMTVLGYFVHWGVVGELLPLGIYCLVLYFMCTSFAELAEVLNDSESAHHFRHHMWVDIVAVLVEIVVHALGLHILGYVAMAVAIYCEAVLMLCIWRFYKQYHRRVLECPI